MRHHHGPHHRGGRHRARRGAIVDAVLTLLGERPMHGYELITEMESRSEGRWRPSPGTMYPALGRMEQGGLLTSDLVDGKKQFTLTEAGRERLAEVREARDGDRQPWHDHGTGRRGDLRRQSAEIVGQARQLGRFGTSSQIRSATEVLAETSRRLYEILADTGAADDSDNGTDTDDDTATE